MKIYLASRYPRRAELEVYADLLKQDGHEVTARWIYGAEEGMPRMENAIMDVDDVRRADAIAIFAEPKGTLHHAGGRHTEFGMAIAWNKLLYVVGGHEQIFFHLPQVLHVKTFKELRLALNFY